MKIVFLSPHYDDAIYSCGGTIFTLTQQGYQVTIWTLMAGIPTLPLPITPVLEDNHQRWQSGENPVLIRRQEDQTASKIVGAKTHYAELLDCIYRTVDDVPLYPSEASLWQTIHPEDPALAYLNTLDLTEFDQVYTPLGVGEHVDHLIVRDWAWQLTQNQSVPVYFYVEYPYCRNRTVVNQALENHPASLQVETRSFSEQAMQHKIKAMATYQSQISSFWDDESAIDDEVRQTFTHDSQFVEEFAHII
ncbi:MAG: PIG-L family deacetylase [Chloroflexota bacterium]